MKTNMPNPRKETVTKVDKNTKDTIELTGELLYRNVDIDDVTVDEMYKNAHVPGEYAGDC